MICARQNARKGKAISSTVGRYAVGQGLKRLGIIREADYTGTCACRACKRGGHAGLLPFNRGHLSASTAVADADQRGFGRAAGGYAAFGLFTILMRLRILPRSRFAI